jgi:peptidoglycan/LPS O-acetylase OafA/YrhL
MLYHLKFGWAEGGLLGVGVFFTLSGYLITDIHLAGLRGARQADRRRPARIVPQLPSTGDGRQRQLPHLTTLVKTEG